MRGSFSTGSTRVLLNTTIAGNEYIQSTNTVSFDSVDVEISVSGYGPKELAHLQYYLDGQDIQFDKYTYFIVKTDCKNIAKNTTSTKNYYLSFQDFSVAKQYIPAIDVNESNFIKLTENNVTFSKEIIGWDEYLESGDLEVLSPYYTTKIKVNIPAIGFYSTSPYSSGVSLTRTVLLGNSFNNPYSMVFYNRGVSPVVYKTSVTVAQIYAQNLLRATYNPLFLQKSWRDNIKVDLKSIYFKEDSPLFDIILQYTKMFGLIWVPDYENKKIRLLHKYTYFKDYTITDWSDKLDRNKDFIIEPITFDTKYIKFNYEDLDGSKYTGYRDKYGANYGDKLLYTGYDFGNETKDLFSKINPSSVSSKTFLSLKAIKGWDLTSSLIPTIDPNVLIDCENEDETSAISSYSWYLRGANEMVSKPIYITDDTPLMKANDEYCWYDTTQAGNNSLSSYSRPVFSVAISGQLFPNLVGRTLGCVFNTPNEDYTSDKSVSQTLGNCIYDLFWRKYINERYNIQNKKVTAYFNLSPTDYMNLNFYNLVTIDNQLFMINKVFDFDLNQRGLTKVELVQVTDIDAYVNGQEKFPTIVVSPDSVQATINTFEEYDSIDLTVQLTKYDENGEPIRGEWGELTGRLTYYNGNPITEEDAKTDPDYDYENYIFVEYGDWQSNIGRDTMILYWDSMAGKAFEGSIDYVLGDEVYTIPISIDFS